MLQDILCSEKARGGFWSLKLFCLTFSFLLSISFAHSLTLIRDVSTCTTCSLYTRAEYPDVYSTVKIPRFCPVVIWTRDQSTGNISSKSRLKEKWISCAFPNCPFFFLFSVQILLLFYLLIIDFYFLPIKLLQQ